MYFPFCLYLNDKFFIFMLDLNISSFISSFFVSSISIFLSIKLKTLFIETNACCKSILVSDILSRELLKVEEYELKATNNPMVKFPLLIS